MTRREVVVSFRRVIRNAEVPSGLKSQVVESLQWSAATKFLGQLANWCITIIVIRLLVPGDYGLMAMANAILGFLAMVAEMGFGASLVQTMAYDRERVRQLFGAALLVNAAFGAVLFASAPLVAGFYQEPRLTAVIRVASLQFIINALAIVPDALLRRELRFKRLSVVEIASGVSGNLVTLLLAFKGYGVWSLVMGALAGGLARAILLQFSVQDRLAPAFRFRGARPLASFGAGVTLTRVLSYFASQADIFIAGKLLGREIVGIYAVAVNLATLPMQRGQAVINDVAFSAFAKIQHDRNALAANLALAIRLTSLFAFPALWGVASVAPEVVRIALGEQWLDAIVPMQIVSLTIPFRMVSAIVVTTRMSVGRIDISIATALAGALLIPLTFFLASRYGLLGLAVAWVAVGPVHFFLSTYGSGTSLGLSQPSIGRNMLRAGSAALVMVLVLALLRVILAGYSDGLRLFLMIAGGAAIYGGMTTLLNRKSASEALRLLVREPRINSDVGRRMDTPI
jgi:teichuronic acid exporter